MSKLIRLLFILLPITACAQSEGGFGFRRYSNTTNLNNTSVSNGNTSASRNAYVHSNGLYYVWDGNSWEREEDIDTLSISGTTLSISLYGDGVPAKTVDLSTATGFGVNIYNADGTQDDADRLFTIDSSQTFAFGQFSSISTPTWGRGFYYDPSTANGVRILNKNGANTTTAVIELDPETINTTTTHTTSSVINSQVSLSENSQFSSTIDRTSDTYGSLLLTGVTNSNEELVALVQNGKGAIPTVSMYLGDGYSTSQYGQYADRAWGVQTNRNPNPGFDWIQVLLPDTGTDTTGNNLNFYNRKYYWLNEAPSSSTADTSVHAWVGNGATTTPIWLDLSQAIFTANNGLTKNTGFNVQLGGTLVKSTAIATAGFQLSVTTGTSSITPLQVTSTTGTALNINSTTGSSIAGSATGSNATANFNKHASTTTGVGVPLQITRSTSGGTATSGIATALDFLTQNGSGALPNTTRLISALTTVTNNAEVSSFAIQLQNTGLGEKFLLSGNGNLKLNLYGDGTFAGTPTYIAGWDTDGNFVETLASSITGVNLYNSNGTTDDNTRTATIQESIRWVGTADFDEPFPFQVISTGTEPNIQNWKGNTDSVWVKQNDTDYEFFSSAIFTVGSDQRLALQADSLQFSTIDSKVKIKNILGVTGSDIVKKFNGDDEIAGAFLTSDGTDWVVSTDLLGTGGAIFGTTAAMTAGSITVNTTAVTANSVIQLTHATLGGTQGILSVGTVTPGTSFVINSSNAADTGTVHWLIIN